MQAAKPTNQLMARTQIEMIGVGENDFRAKLFERFLRERFDRGLSTDGQKERRLHHAVRRGQAATSSPGGIGLQDFKRKTHPLSVSGENPCDAYTKQGEKYVDAGYNSKRLGHGEFLGVHIMES
jgi:hypothetical protein